MLNPCLEGEGGPLTEFDSEESPLSIVQVVRRSEKTEMFRLMLQKRYDTGCVQWCWKTEIALMSVRRATPLEQVQTVTIELHAL